MNPQIVGANTIGQLQSTFRNNNIWQPFVDIEQSQTGEFGKFADVDVAVSKMGTDFHLCVVTNVGKLFYVLGRISNNTVTTWSAPYEITLTNYNPRIDTIHRIACDLVGSTLYIFGLTTGGQIFSAVRQNNGTWSHTNPYLNTVSGTGIRAVDIGCFTIANNQLDIPLTLSDGTFVSIFADTTPFISPMIHLNYSQILFPNGLVIGPNGSATQLKRVCGVVVNNIPTYFFTTEVGELLAFRLDNQVQNNFVDIRPLNRPLNNLPQKKFTDMSCSFKNNTLHLVGIDDRGNINYTQLNSNTFSGNFIDIEQLVGERGTFLAAGIG